MTNYEFVRDIWQNSDAYTQPMDLDTARCDLDNFRADRWDLPEDLTAEEYVTIWNELAGYVTDADGRPVHFATAVELMDDDLREQLNADMSPCSDQRFYDAYCEAHQEKFGEAFRIN